MCAFPHTRIPACAHSHKCAFLRSCARAFLRILMQVRFCACVFLRTGPYSRSPFGARRRSFPFVYGPTQRLVYIFSPWDKFQCLLEWWLSKVSGSKSKGHSGAKQRSSPSLLCARYEHRLSLSSRCINTKQTNIRLYSPRGLSLYPSMFSPVHK